MGLREIVSNTGRILLIPVYGLVLLGVIIIGLFKHKTVSQTLDELIETREY